MPAFEHCANLNRLFSTKLNSGYRGQAAVRRDKK